MVSVPRKAKQYLTTAVKLLVVAGAFYFIYNQLANNDKLDWVRFDEQFRDSWSVAGVLFILLLSFLNRYFEILKWQNLVGHLQIISVGESAKQVLSAVTAAIFTPNGLGEYGAKVLFFDKHHAKEIVFLNLLCNGIQMVLTVVFGIFGLLYFNAHYNVITPRTVGLLFGLLLAVSVLFFALRRFTIRGYSLHKLIKKINSVSHAIHRRNILLAVCRYLVFSHQYYFLFLAFGVDMPYLTLMSVITAVYFLASSLPTFQFLDFAVKGGVAVYFFGLLGVNEWVVVFITMLMWFLNVVLPVVIGSYYVLKFKSKWN